MRHAHATNLFDNLEPCVHMPHERCRVRSATQCRKMCVRQQSVCTPSSPVAHTVDATTWVRNPQKSACRLCETLKKKFYLYKFMKHKLIFTLEIALSNIPRDVLVLTSALETVLANIHRDVLVLLDVADVHQCSKVDVPCCCVCLFNDLVSFLVHCCLCSWNQQCLGCKIFCTCSRFPEACVSERQISRIV